MIVIFYMLLGAALGFEVSIFLKKTDEISFMELFDQEDFLKFSLVAIIIGAFLGLIVGLIIYKIRKKKKQKQIENQMIQNKLIKEISYEKVMEEAQLAKTKCNLNYQNDKDLVDVKYVTSLKYDTAISELTKMSELLSEAELLIKEL